MGSGQRSKSDDDTVEEKTPANLDEADAAVPVKRPTKAQIAEAVESTRTLEDEARPSEIEVPPYLERAEPTAVRVTPPRPRRGSGLDKRIDDDAPGFSDVAIPDPTEPEERAAPRRGWPVAPLIALAVIFAALVAAAVLRD